MIMWLLKISNVIHFAEFIFIIIHNDKSRYIFYNNLPDVTTAYQMFLHLSNVTTVYSYYLSLPYVIIVYHDNLQWVILLPQVTIVLTTIYDDLLQVTTICPSQLQQQYLLPQVTMELIIFTTYYRNLPQFATIYNNFAIYHGLPQ